MQSVISIGYFKRKRKNKRHGFCTLKYQKKFSSVTSLLLSKAWLKILTDEVLEKPFLIACYTAIEWTASKKLCGKTKNKQ
jgi:hypothetical protein